MARSVEVPRTFAVEATCTLRSGEIKRVTGQVYGKTLGEALDSDDFDSLMDENSQLMDEEKPDAIGIALNIREAGT